MDILFTVTMIILLVNIFCLLTFGIIMNLITAYEHGTKFIILYILGWVFFSPIMIILAVLTGIVNLPDLPDTNQHPLDLP